jgi:hypothetical protein
MRILVSTPVRGIGAALRLHKRNKTLKLRATSLIAKRGLCETNTRH